MKKQIDEKEVLKNWQRIVDIAADLMDVTCALITKVEQPYIKIIKTTNSSDNPLKNNEKFKISGHYCEKIIQDKKMLAIENSLNTDDWKNSPEIKLGLISYLGFPIETPEGEIFGTICVLNKQERVYSQKDKRLLLEFKQVVETQLKNVDLNNKLASRIEKSKKLKEKYYNLFNSINDFLFLHQSLNENNKDKPGKIIEVNKRASDILGYKRRELLGKSLDDISAIKLDRKKELFNDLDKNEEITYEDLFLTREGKKIIVEINSKTINHNDQKVVLSAARDMTRRKQAEKELKEKKDLFEGAIESISDIILIQKPDHTIHQYNKSANDLLNREIESDEIKGKKCYELMGKNKECENCPVRKTINNKRLEEVEKYFPEQDSYFDIRSQPILDKKGEILFIIEHLRDITERKEKNRKIRENKNLLQSLTNKTPGAVYQYQLFPDGSSLFPYATGDIYEIYEVTPKEVKEEASKVFERIHPEDYERITTSIKTSAENLTVWEEEYRVELPEKGIRWLEGYAEPEKKPDGSVLWHGNIRDITKKKKGENRLKKQLQFQELVSDISSQLLNVNYENFKQTINQSLKKVANFFGFDHSFVFKFFAEDKYLLNTHHWTAEDVKPIKEGLHKLSTDKLSWLLEKLYSREEIIIEDVNQMHKEAEIVQEMLTKQKFKSLVFIPIFIEADLHGFYTFSLVKENKNFKKEEISKLKILSDVITRSFSEFFKNEEIEKLYQKLNSEIKKTAVIHEKNFLADQPEYEEISFATFFNPAERVGGDFYNFIKVDNKLIFYLSDITGHGLEGVVFNSFIKESISSYIELKDTIEIAEMMDHVYDQYLKNDFPDDYFICLFMMVLDLESMEMEYISSGFQHFPLAVKNEKEIVLKNSGFPISSAIPEDMIDFKKSSFHLKKDTTILFYTDGIVEQMQNEIIYGNRLREVFYKNSNLKPEELKDKILDDFKEFNNNSLDTDDDITFIIMKN